jgi:hypothetical protein
MKTNKLLKPNRLTLAVRAAMNPKSLTGAALVLAASQSHAAVINVGGACTLVRAIVAANNDTMATGHCRKGLGPDTIVLPPNSVQTLTAVNNVAPYGPTGLPVIRRELTIHGEWVESPARTLYSTICTDAGNGYVQADYGPSDLRQWHATCFRAKGQWRRAGLQLCCFGVTVREFAKQRRVWSAREFVNCGILVDSTSRVSRYKSSIVHNAWGSTTIDLGSMLHPTMWRRCWQIVFWSGT